MICGHPGPQSVVLVFAPKTPQLNGSFETSTMKQTLLHPLFFKIAWSTWYSVIFEWKICFLFYDLFWMNGIFNMVCVPKYTIPSAVQTLTQVVAHWRSRSNWCCVYLLLSVGQSERLQVLDLKLLYFCLNRSRKVQESFYINISHVRDEVQYTKLVDIAE